MTLVTRDLTRQVSTTDRNYMPETEVSLNINMPSDYVPTLLYPTTNKVFVSAVKSDFYDMNNLMNLKLYAIDKVSNGAYWTSRPNDFQEIDLTGYTGNNFQLESAIPSLVSDKLLLRLKRVSDGNKFNLNVSSLGVDVVDLGSKGAISSKHAVVSGR